MNPNPSYYKDTSCYSFSSLSSTKSFLEAQSVYILLVRKSCCLLFQNCSALINPRGCWGSCYLLLCGTQHYSFLMRAVVNNCLDGPPCLYSINSCQLSLTTEQDFWLERSPEQPEGIRVSLAWPSAGYYRFQDGVDRKDQRSGMRAELHFRKNHEGIWMHVCGGDECLPEAPGLAAKVWFSCQLWLCIIVSTRLQKVDTIQSLKPGDGTRGVE